MEGSSRLVEQGSIDEPPDRVFVGEGSEAGAAIAKATAFIAFDKKIAFDFSQGIEGDSVISRGMTPIDADPQRQNAAVEELVKLLRNDREPGVGEFLTCRARV